MKTKLSFILCLVGVFLYANFGYPQESEVAKFPRQPITYIHPLPPGTGSDALIRIYCKEVEKFLGQPIITINKPGGGLTIGAAAIAVAKPDGYTIGFTGASALFIAPFTEKLPYEPLKDFTQILQYGAPCFGVTVKANSPFKTFKDIIDYARQNPKKMTYGTTGKIGLHYLIMEQIARKEKVQLTQIPFRGGIEVDTALLGGHIDLGASEFNPSHIEQGLTRLLLLFREEPSPEFPQALILKDLGYGDIAAPMIQCIAGPKGIPEGIVKKLEDAFTKAMKEPAFLKGMKETGYSVRYRNSKDLNDYIVRNHEIFGKLLKELEIIK